LEFPGAMVIVKALPFAKVFHVSVNGFPVRDEPFNIATGFVDSKFSFSCSFRAEEPYGLPEIPLERRDMIAIFCML
jgi:hypothetical protein